jgi:hypothetical protein
MTVSELVEALRDAEADAEVVIAALISSSPLLAVDISEDGREVVLS